MAQTIYDFEAKTIDGKAESLGKYKGKCLLIVNIASKCGFTVQYKELQELYSKHKDKGFAILGFPCNQFGGQEPGSESEIKTFCSMTYGVSFPLYSKVDVNGAGAHPLYKFLTSSKPGILGTEAVKWNFTKFLISRDGVPIKRFASNATADKLGPDIEKELG